MFEVVYITLGPPPTDPQKYSSRLQNAKPLAQDPVE